MVTTGCWSMQRHRCPHEAAPCGATGAAAHRPQQHRRAYRSRRKQQVACQAWVSAAPQRDDDGPSTSGNCSGDGTSLLVLLGGGKQRRWRLYAQPPAGTEAQFSTPMQARAATASEPASSSAWQAAPLWPHAANSTGTGTSTPIRRPRLAEGSVFTSTPPSSPSFGHSTASTPSSNPASAAGSATPASYAMPGYYSQAQHPTHHSSDSGAGLAADSKLVAELESQVRATSSIAELQQLLLTFRRPVRPPAGSSQVQKALSPAAAAVAAAAAATSGGSGRAVGGPVPLHVYVLMLQQLSKLHAASVAGAPESGSPAVPSSHQQVQETIQMLLRVLDPALPSLSGYHLAVLLSSLVRLRYNPQEEWLERFLALTTPMLKDCGAVTLTAYARSVAFLPLLPWDLKSIRALLPWLDALLMSVRRQLPSFRGEELVKLLEALARIKFKPRDDWLMDFTRALRSRIDSLDSAHLSRGIAAFAALKLTPDHQLLRAYYVQLYSKLPLFDDKELSTTAEAFAVLHRVMQQSFFEEFLEETMLKLPTFKPLSLGNLMRALGSIVRSSPEQQEDLSLPPSVVVPERYVATLGRHVEEGMWNFSGVVCSNCAWGLAMMGFKATQRFMDRYIEATRLRMHELHTGPLSRMLVALTVYKYQPQDERSARNLDGWYTYYFNLCRRRSFTVPQVCHLLTMMVHVPKKYVTPELIAHLLHTSCTRGNPRNIGPPRLVGITKALQLLDHRPPFYFAQMLTQTARCHWTQFTPKEHADLLEALCFLGCPATLDTLWVNEFLAIIQCRLDQFAPSSMARLLNAVVHLPSIKPGPQWLALVVARVQQTVDEYSAAEMCDVLVSLARFGYRPPPEVFDSFVQHVTDKADTLPAERTAELSDALMALVPGYLGGSDGHEQYQALQLRLRAVEVPARVMSQAIPSALALPEAPGQVTGPRGGIAVVGVGRLGGPKQRYGVGLDARGTGAGGPGGPPARRTRSAGSARGRRPARVESGSAAAAPRHLVTAQARGE